MKVQVKFGKKLNKFLNTDWDSTINKAMTRVTLMVQNKAKELAPVDTGTLRRSITSDFSRLSQGITVVGSPVPYARRRHFENYKNPQTLLYLERGYTEQESELKSILKNALENAIR